MSKDLQKDEKIKYINITEARACFSTIVGDKTSFYVITKNSKPKRVVVNYNDFLLLQSLHSTSMPAVQQTPSSIDQGLAETPKKKAKTTPEHPTVKGLLKERMEQGGIEGGDYFGGEGEGDLYHGEEDALVENPAEISDGDFEKDEEKNLSDSSRGTPEGDIFQQSLDQKEEEKKEDDDETFLKDLEEKHSPEERDYFLRYRKLYESLDPSRNRSHHGLKKLPPRQEALSLEDIEKQVQESFQVGAMQESPLKKTSPQKQDSFAVEEKEGLPSLQDLLEDLEQEKLSDEEEDSLDEQEINELINRITSD